MGISTIGREFRDKLALEYSPVGYYYAEGKPDGAIGFKKKGGGCIMPLIFKAAKGATVAFDENSTGGNCSAYFLGYKDWIFPGVEYFLSHGPLIGRMCERLVKSPKLAKHYLESIKLKGRVKGAIVFKPLENFGESENPEAVIFFANPDQLSALVYLLHFGAPLEQSRIVTGFASACGSVVTLPLLYARSGKKAAVWGLHDITARPRLPKEIMTITVPLDLLAEMSRDMKESFLYTARWEKIVERITGTPARSGTRYPAT